MNGIGWDNVGQKLVYGLEIKQMTMFYLMKSSLRDYTVQLCFAIARLHVGC